MRKKLPIGIQTFRDIRDKKENYLYVDKTDIAYELIESGKYYFLSRPRRFGKSLFIDTLHSIFEGKKELFEGLAIYDKWDWDRSYPVIKISWSGDFQTLNNLTLRAKEILKTNQERLGVICQNTEYMPNCFDELIRKTSQKYNEKVVILIDEYDKPILDSLEDIQQAKINRDFIKSLYTIIKDNDQYLKFVMLTGVSKFSKSSIFSGLNMLEDISLDKRYGNICGYTQENIEDDFQEHLVGVDLKKLKVWYNGYNFLKDDVYNPFDLLLFIRNDFRYSNYWFSTGTPSFLIKLIEKNSYFLPSLSNLVVGEKLLDSFDIENLDLEVILYQAGYLTIESTSLTPFESIEYKLKLPNKEVKQSLNDTVIEFLTKNKNPNRDKIPIYNALLSANLQALKSAFVTMFASIPYNNFTNNTLQEYEGYYASVIYVYLQSLGLDIIGEDVTNRGRIDLTVKIENYIYIIEFKVDGKKGEALQQIKAKEYAQKYLTQDKEMYLVGIEFSKAERSISSFEWERV